MSIKPGDALKLSLFTYDPSTGALAAPTGTPTIALRHNAVLDAGQTFTVTNNATGDYKLVLAAGSMAAYVTGDLIEVMATATVAPSLGGANVTSTSILLRAVLDGLRVSDVPSVVLVTPSHLLAVDSSGAIALPVAPPTGYGSVPLTGGTSVVGSTAGVVIVAGLPAGRSYTTQKLYHVPSGEARVIASQTVAGGNYTFTMGVGVGELGPFSAAPTIGDTHCPVP
jgi:hypothetical protein